MLKMKVMNLSHNAPYATRDEIKKDIRHDPTSRLIRSLPAQNG